MALQTFSQCLEISQIPNDKIHTAKTHRYVSICLLLSVTVSRLGRKVFAYLNANVVKVFKDARDDGVKKLHPPLGEDVIGNGLYQFT
jgi:hypothetical protein